MAMRVMISLAKRFSQKARSVSYLLVIPEKHPEPISSMRRACRKSWFFYSSKQTAQDHKCSCHDILQALLIVEIGHFTSS